MGKLLHQVKSGKLLYFEGKKRKANEVNSFVFMFFSITFLSKAKKGKWRESDGKLKIQIVINVNAFPAKWRQIKIVLKFKSVTFFPGCGFLSHRYCDK